MNNHIILILHRLYTNCKLWEPTDIRYPLHKGLLCSGSNFSTCYSYFNNYNNNNDNNNNPMMLQFWICHVVSHRPLPRMTLDNISQHTLRANCRRSTGMHHWLGSEQQNFLLALLQISPKQVGVGPGHGCALTVCHNTAIDCRQVHMYPLVPWLMAKFTTILVGARSLHWDYKKNTTIVSWL